jgi:hypothetical protein
MRIDPRVDRHRKSLVALEAFLKEVCAKPRDFTADEELCTALKSQGALASLERTDRGIMPGSINTFKRNADVILGGFSALDGLRLKAKAAIDALKERPRRAYGTRGALEAEASELRRELETLREDLVISTQVIGLALQQGRSYADSAGPDVVARCQKEQRQLLAFLATRTNTVDIGSTT